MVVRQKVSGNWQIVRGRGRGGERRLMVRRCLHGGDVHLFLRGRDEVIFIHYSFSSFTYKQLCPSVEFIDEKSTMELF